jgi:hypothetical protein
MSQTKYEEIVYMQGDDAEEALTILQDQGEEACLEHLKQWDNGDASDFSGDGVPWGKDDELIFGEGGYIVSYNPHLDYIALQRKYVVKG